LAQVNVREAQTETADGTFKIGTFRTLNEGKLIKVICRGFEPIVFEKIFEVI